MDDFLHNLRSGKLKQTDRTRRDYSDYKGPQRRAGNERRRTDYYAKVTNENFAMIKETLDRFAEQQRRIADAMEARCKMEARVAGALEAIAAMLSSEWGHSLPSTANAIAPDLDAIADHGSPPSDTSQAQSAAGNALQRITAKGNGRLGDDQIPDIVHAIAGMRKKGDSWEKIARHFDEKGVPTVSGKGKWRGTTIKKLWDANSAQMKA